MLNINLHNAQFATAHQIRVLCTELYVGVLALHGRPSVHHSIASFCLSSRRRETI